MSSWVSVGLSGTVIEGTLVSGGLVAAPRATVSSFRVGTHLVGLVFVQCLAGS